MVGGGEQRDWVDALAVGKSCPHLSGELLLSVWPGSVRNCHLLPIDGASYWWNFPGEVSTLSWITKEVRLKMRLLHHRKQDKGAAEIATVHHGEGWSVRLRHAQTLQYKSCWRQEAPSGLPLSLCHGHHISLYRDTLLLSNPAPEHLSYFLWIPQSCKLSVVTY